MIVTFWFFLWFTVTGCAVYWQTAIIIHWDLFRDPIPLVMSLFDSLRLGFVHSEHINSFYASGLFLTTQKMKFSIRDFFSKCDQICKKVRIWSHLLKKSSMENFIFCAVSVHYEILWFSDAFIGYRNRRVARNKLTKIFCITVSCPPHNNIGLQDTQLTFTCSKSTMKTLDKGVKYVQS